MPGPGEAKSKAQQEMFAIAEHKPDILYDKNKKILGDMDKTQIHNFAATKTTNLPKKKIGPPRRFGPKSPVQSTNGGVNGSTERINQGYPSFSRP